MITTSIPFRGLCSGLCALAFAPPALAGGSSFQGLGDLPGGNFGSSGWAVSGDGMAVAGQSSSDNADSEAFLWSSAAGMIGIGDLDGEPFQSFAAGISGDGSVVVGQGQSGSGSEAFLWTEADGMLGLGDLPGGSFSSSAADVSADGTVVVGTGVSATGPVPEAFRWTEGGGMIGLGDLPGSVFDSRGLGVSGNGNVIVGNSASASGREAFRWTESDGMVGLGDLPGDFFSSSAEAANANGSVVVGYGRSASGTEAMRWTQAGGMVGLGDLPGGSFSSTANDVSADGAVIVGFGNSANGQEAFIWDESSGIRSLKDVLENEYGLDLTGWTLFEAKGISDDGLTITGPGLNPDGMAEGWIAVLDPGTAARVANFTVQTGAHVSGNTADLRESDNNFLKIDAAFINGGSPPYQMIVEVKLKTEIIDPTSIHILVEGKLSQNGGTAKLYLRNWAQGGWTLISNDPIGKTEMTQKAGGLDPSDYINASGVMKLRIKHTKTTGSFRSLIDHVQALVR